MYLVMTCAIWWIILMWKLSHSSLLGKKLLLATFIMSALGLSHGKSSANTLLCTATFKNQWRLFLCLSFVIFVGDMVWSKLSPMISNLGIVGEIWSAFLVIKSFKIILLFSLLATTSTDSFNWKWFRCLDGKLGNSTLPRLVFKVSDFNSVVGLYNTCTGSDLGTSVQNSFLVT